MDGAGRDPLATDRNDVAGRVRRRRVFYLPGYDPFPPRRYRELYRREGAAQAAISGYAMAQVADEAGWHVTALIDGSLIETRVEVLGWSDLVRASMGGGIAASYLQMLCTVAVYLRGGALWRLWRLRRGPVLAGFYPVAMLLAQLVLACLAGLVVARLAGGFAGLAGTGLLLLAFRRVDHRLFAHYLMHDLAFSAGGGGAYPSALEARLVTFRARLRAALDGQADEVLVVGHSSGAHLAVSVLAGLLREGLPETPVVGLLTLGQVVPMLSFLPDAGRLRADLRDMAAQDRIAWVDVTAPGDPCCFALCDPVAVTGVAPPAARWPLVISAAYSRTLDPVRLRALRWRFFRLHFQYLCAFDRPGAYDYFAITAGPQTLAARFAGGRPSPGRVGVALSPHRGLTE
jgi:hypothetical protein